MCRVSIGAGRGLRCGIVGLLLTSIMVAVACAPAEARWLKRKATRANASTSIVSDARYADIVIDANTGDVLHAANPDSLRHPASVTKIMTLYLLFERIEAGKITLDTPLEVSAEAASQAPSKLGLRPGQSIKVEDAIKALVTKSANDVAVVVAEAQGPRAWHEPHRLPQCFRPAER
jgi:D-alanyl-D-alanine carboxypeptidase